MDDSGTVSTRNSMATWGDGGKYEGRDDDTRMVPWRLSVRLSVIVVNKEEQE